METVDEVGTQELRELLITIKRPHLKKPYIPTDEELGKHDVEQGMGITNRWYKGFLREWKGYVEHRYRDTPYFFPSNGGHLEKVSALPEDKT